MNAPWPSEIKLSADKRLLTVSFDDGASFGLPAEYLRVLSPSAEVQGHGPDERKTVGGKKNVAIRAIEPMGRYAVKLVFDDGHDTGIYSWPHLRELGEKRQEKWTAYLDDLVAKGLERDRG